MSILVNKDSRIIVQGFTGKEGTFHSQNCMEYGANIVAGVSPGKRGNTHLGKPIYNSVLEAVRKTRANVSLIFVPPAFAADAIMEAAAGGIKVIVAITEGIPVRDIMYAKEFVQKRGATLIGPNCPGIITPEETKIGIMPGFIFKKGNVGLISKSGTLTYEAANQIVKAGMGISTAIGIGGDPIIGSTFVDLLKLFKKDPETESVVIIGEIGGELEIEAAKYIKQYFNKPVVAFIAGQTAPKGKRMGHAGAIIAGSKGTAQEKMRILAKAGVAVAETPAVIGQTLLELLK